MPINVDEWLRELGLAQYTSAFKDIDGAVLPYLTAEDLTALGITSVGHRRRMLSEIAALRQKTEFDRLVSLAKKERFVVGGILAVGGALAVSALSSVIACLLVAVFAFRIQSPNQEVVRSLAEATMGLKKAATELTASSPNSQQPVTIDRVMQLLSEGGSSVERHNREAGDPWLDVISQSIA